MKKVNFLFFVTVILLPFVFILPAMAYAGYFAQIGNMNNGRANASMTVLQNGQVLITGGGDGTTANTASNTAEIYNPNNSTFRLVGNMNSARYDHQATLLPDGKVLITGGVSSQDAFPTLSSAELFDPVTEQFIVIPDMTSCRSLHRAILLPNGKVLITGGSIDYYALATAELYDLATNTFTAINNMKSSRRGHTMTLLDTNEVLIVGGTITNGTVTGTAEIFNSATDIFTLTGSLIQERYKHKAVLLPFGQVSIIGGYQGGSNPLSILTKVEVYNQTTGIFNDAGDLIQRRDSPTATLLTTGKILVTGGYIDLNETVTTSAELYDPSTKTSTSTGNMSCARVWHSAALLSNGNVLIIGGNNGYNTSAYTSAELYIPAFSNHAPIIQVSPTTYDFGNVEYETTRTMALTLSNRGTVDLVISSASFSNTTSAGEYGLSLPIPLPQVLAPGQISTWGISFQTNSLFDIHTASLNIASNDPTQPSVTVQFSGESALSSQPSVAIDELLAFVRQSILDGTLYGIGNTPEKMAKKVEKLEDMILTIGDLIDRNKTNKACNQLDNLSKKVDEQPKPRDLVDGSATVDVLTGIHGIMISLACN